MKYTRKNLFIISFLLPGIILFLVIYAYPVINIVFTSFSEWNYTNLSNPRFLGFKNMFGNYKELFTKNYYFGTAFVNSLKWVLLQGCIQVPFGLIVAIVLSYKPKGWRFIRNVFIIPCIISSAAIGLIFLNLYDPSRGLVTELIKFFSPGSDINILAGEKSAFWGITFSFVLFSGISMLLILSRIFSIPDDIFEAARIDGAGKFTTVTYITLPLLRPVIGTALVMACTSGLLVYNEIALITSGGPDKATYSLSYFIYKTAMGSSKLNFALANTAGVIQFVLGIMLVGILSKAFRTGLSYAD